MSQVPPSLGKWQEGPNGLRPGRSPVKAREPGSGGLSSLFLHKIQHLDLPESEQLPNPKKRVIVASLAIKATGFRCDAVLEVSAVSAVPFRSVYL